jgi:hypothetical protein
MGSSSLGWPIWFQADQVDRAELGRMDRRPDVMAKQIRKFIFDRRSTNALVEHMVGVVAEFSESSDTETIRRGVMEMAATLATQYPDPRARRGYIEMISDGLSVVLPR